MSIVNERLHKHYVDLEDSLLAQGRAAGVLTSPTGIGRARELILNEFLALHLPQRLSVVRGEMVDVEGNTSGELDTMLRDQQSLAWGVGGETLLAVEAAVGAIEIKSSLHGDHLEDALQKIARLKRLRRLPHHGFYIPTDDAKVELPHRTPRGYVVAFDGPVVETIGGKIVENRAWFDDDYLCLGPELIVVLGRGFIFKNDNEILQAPAEAAGNFVHGVVDRPGLEALAMHVTETVRRYGQLTYDVTPYAN